MLTENICDLCESNNNNLIYNPIGTRRGLKVFICEDCGLVQSFPKIDHVAERNVMASSAADWGNIRYGKQFRTKHDLDLLLKYINISELKNCLDVGSNRGHFINNLFELNNSLVIWGVEPDEPIFNFSLNRNKRFNMINDRIENIKLPPNYFELVYLSHTLEHLKSPRLSLKQINECLKQDGILYVEVPNIDFIDSVDVVEEWFIDKHLYHFSVNPLIHLITCAGFEIVYCSDKSDKLNISIVAKKTKKNMNQDLNSDFSRNKQLIFRYENKIKLNREKLTELGSYLNNLGEEKKLVIWGAGRIFDTIVKIGGLDTNKVFGLIDKHLSDFVSSTNGLKIYKPKDFKKLNPDVVFICSREYFIEIKNEIVKIDNNVNIFGYSQNFQ